MLNKIILQGRLTKTPELTSTKNSTTLCRFTIANETGYGDYKKTNFIDCIAWKGTGETVSKHFQKGSEIIIDGVLEQNQYTDREGKQQTAFEVTVDRVYFPLTKAAEKAPEAPAEPPKYAAENAPKFEEITDDERLPF